VALDAQANPTQKMITAPKHKDPTVRHHYKWDAWNRLVAVWMDDGDNQREITGEDPQDIHIATYRYDGQNRRIRKLLGTNPAAPNPAYDYYYNASWQIVEVRKGGSAGNSGDTIRGNSGDTIRFFLLTGFSAASRFGAWHGSHGKIVLCPQISRAGACASASGQVEERFHAHYDQTCHIKYIRVCVHCVRCLIGCTCDSHGPARISESALGRLGGCCSSMYVRLVRGRMRGVDNIYRATSAKLMIKQWKVGRRRDARLGRPRPVASP
jgi:hypothetical protein